MKLIRLTFLLTLFSLALPGVAADDPSNNTWEGPIPAATVEPIKYLTSREPATLTPATVEFTGTEPGDVLPESKLLHLPADVSPAKGDVLICFDLTGSMGGELNNVKVNAINIMNAVRAFIPDTYFGVVSHMDYNGYHSGCGYGDTYGAGGDYPYALNSGLTDELTAVQAAVNALTLGNGYDGPENYTRVLYETTADPAIGWRPGAKKIVLLWGDYVPHDCDVYGIIGGGGTTGPDPGRDEIDENGDDLEIIPVLNAMAAQNLTLLSLHSGGVDALWQAYAEVTGGASFQINYDGTIPGGTDIADFIVQIIGEEVSMISSLTLEVCTPGYESWLTGVVPAAYTNIELDVAHDLPFDIEFTVPAGATPGWHYFDVCAIGDGAEYARQSVAIEVIGETPECPWADATTPPIDDPGLGNGVAWGDYDDDGDYDLFVTNIGANHLYRNDGGGVFADTGMDFGSDVTFACAWGDYDNDGDEDIYLANYGTANRLYRNDGGVFADATVPPLDDTEQGYNVAWGDFDDDGDLDLYLTNFEGTNRLFRNDGGAWTDMAGDPIEYSGKSRGCAWGDYDDDGDLDMYVSCHWEPNKLFRNDGGVFVDVSAVPLDDPGPGKGVAWGDYDNDGDLDLYLVNNGTANKLFQNQGDGTFADVTDAVTGDEGNGRACGWGDYNNDGYLDLYFTNYGQDNHLLENVRGTFTDVTCPPLERPYMGWGMAWADYDEDGDLDLYMADHSYGTNQNVLAENLTIGGTWLQIDVAGRFSNRDGVGAKVTVETRDHTQTQFVAAGSHYHGQSAKTLHFGLDWAASADIVVRWPSGLVQRISGVPANQRIEIFETATTDVGDDTPRAHRLVGNTPNPFNPLTTIEFVLASDARVDLKVYDAAGSLVRTLRVAAPFAAGNHGVVWDGRDDVGAQVSSGTYFYRFEAGEVVDTGSMTLIK